MVTKKSKVKKESKSSPKRRKLNKAKLTNVNDWLDKTYGKKGTKKRDELHEKNCLFFYGDQLKDKRKKLKMSQQDLADKIGKTRVFVSQVENGRDARFSNFLLIAQALGLSISFQEH